MLAAAPPASSPLETLTAPPPPDALAAAAWQLEPPLPHERRGVLREEAALLVDSLLARVARGRGALDVTLGEGLAFLADGDRLLRLGYSGIGDYACARLGMNPRTGQSTAQLARALRDLPLLRAAVRRGEVSTRKAQVILPVARGDAEPGWVERARASTVRALEADVRAAGAAPVEREDATERVALPVGPEARERLDAALALAGKLLGPTSPRWERLEAICAEFLGAFPVEPTSDEDGAAPEAGAAEWLDAARAALEEETARWEALESVDPCPAPDPGAVLSNGDLHRVDAELRAVAAMRDRWDELLGHLVMLLTSLGLWREAGFSDFAHYCDERLGLARRTVEQRAALERRLQALPPLRAALRTSRVSYEQARLVASVADETSVDEWIARAEQTTSVALRRELDAAEDTQMRAVAELSVRTPPRVAALLAAAFRAARAAAGRWLTPDECLVAISGHFLATWEDAVRVRTSPARRVADRDRRFCQVPGCSRAASHAHHVLLRSHGGADDPENLVSLCAAHHLHAVHRGWIRVSGRAPDALRWELGVRSDGPPLAVHGPLAAA